jgi:hypothetical protein
VTDFRKKANRAFGDRDKDAEHWGEVSILDLCSMTSNAPGRRLIAVWIGDTIDVKRNQPRPYRSHPFAESIPDGQSAQCATPD